MTTKNHQSQSETQPDVDDWALIFSDEVPGLTPDERAEIEANIVALNMGYPIVVIVDIAEDD